MYCKRNSIDLQPWLVLHEDELYEAWSDEAAFQNKASGLIRRQEMYFSNGFVYGGTPVELMKITKVKPLDNMMLLLTFSSGEQRLYDTSQLLKYPIFEPLRDKEVFSHPELDHDVVTWLDGELDIAPESMYENSYPYVARA